MSDDQEQSTIGTGKAGPGRPPGLRNRLTLVREALLDAFDTVGGAAYLVSVARDDPKTFCTLLGKVLPSTTTVAGDPDNPITNVTRLEVVLVRPPARGP